MNLRDMERDSIRRFVQQAASEGYLSGRVLDYGCGKQPYRDIVEGVGGQYVPFDRVDLPANVSGEDVGDNSAFREPLDAILSTQTAQYIPYFGGSLKVYRRDLLRPGGHLVMTYPTNWPEVEVEDLQRFTKAGMERLLAEAGFKIIMHHLRAQIAVMIDPSATMALGYGVVARA